MIDGLVVRVITYLFTFTQNNIDTLKSLGEVKASRKQRIEDFFSMRCKREVTNKT